MQELLLRFSLEGKEKKRGLVCLLVILQGYIEEFSSCSDLPLELKDKEKEVFSNLKEIYQWRSRYRLT